MTAKTLMMSFDRSTTAIVVRTKTIWKAIETRETRYDFATTEEKIKNDPEKVLAIITTEVKIIAIRILGGYLNRKANIRVRIRVATDKKSRNENSVDDFF